MDNKTNLDNLTNSLLEQFPKVKPAYTQMTQPDNVSSLVRECKTLMMAQTTLDKKIAVLNDYCFNKISSPSERLVFLSVFKQSLYRDIFLSGLGIGLGTILFKGGAELDSKEVGKLFKYTAVSAGFTSITYSSKTLATAISMLRIVGDMLNKLQGVQK